MEFFNVRDFEIPGYSLPHVVVELHAHLWSCAVVYRFIYAPPVVTHTHTHTHPTHTHTRTHTHTPAHTHPHTYTYICGAAPLCITSGADTVPDCDHVLGVCISADLSLDRHVSVVSSASFYWLRGVQ